MGAAYRHRWVWVLALIALVLGAAVFCAITWQSTRCMTFDAPSPTHLARCHIPEGHKMLRPPSSLARMAGRHHRRRRRGFNSRNDVYAAYHDGWLWVLASTAAVIGAAVLQVRGNGISVMGSLAPCAAAAASVWCLRLLHTQRDALQQELGVLRLRVLAFLHPARRAQATAFVGRSTCTVKELRQHLTHLTGKRFRKGGKRTDWYLEVDGMVLRDGAAELAALGVQSGATVIMRRRGWPLHAHGAWGAPACCTMPCQGCMRGVERQSAIACS